MSILSSVIHQQHREIGIINIINIMGLEGSSSKNDRLLMIGMKYAVFFGIYRYKIQLMGPISPYGPKQFGRLTEQDILNESEKFIAEQKLCDKQDEIFQTLRLVIAKINIYGHRHLLDHIRNTPDKNKKIQFLTQWRSLNFQNLDLLFQNLIRKKIMRIDDEQVFTKVELHEKYSQVSRDRGKEVYERGEDLIRQRKVGVIIFVGSSSTKGEQTFNKEFYKAKPTDSCLFEILMQRLKEIGDAFGFPPTYIFYNANNYNKITDFLKTYKYSENIQICLQNTHPILNLNGNLCLKASDQGDVIELPNGSGDFYHSSIKGVSILEKLKMDKVEYISCVDCQNILEMVIDPYVLGLLDTNKNDYDLMYKCTYPEDQREKIFRRVVLQNGVAKADTLQALNSFINYNHKYRLKNNQNVFSSPVWMNHLVFNLEKVASTLQNANNVSSFPQTVNYTMKYMSYWSPIDCQWHNHQSCYVFQRQISDLLINNLFKSKAIMVQRQEQYLPVITEKKEHSWQAAYRQYTSKKAKNTAKPFYQRFNSQQQEQKPVQVESKQQKIEISEHGNIQIVASSETKPEKTQANQENSDIYEEQKVLIIQ